jgi:hypothetical protein
MECFVCSKKLKNGYLCKEHASELYSMLEKGEGEVENPDWKSHCLICGEFEHRRLIDYPSAGPFCDKDIKEEWERNNKDEISEDAE